MAVKGIDVSEFAGTIQWDKVKADGIAFAMIRAGYGSSTANLDTQFERNINGALAADVSVGAYWFSYAYTPEMARHEADVLMEVMEPYKGMVSYPLSFDWEADSDRYAREQGVIPTRELITDMAVAFLQELENGGWYAMNYTDLDYYYNQFIADRLAPYDLWLADYNGVTNLPCGMQQTGDSAQINGIESDSIDTDLAFKDYPSIIRRNGLNGYKKESETGEDEGMIYNHIVDVPEWARPTIQKLVDKGYLKGDGKGNLELNETMLRLLVINERAGLYN